MVDFVTTAVPLVRIINYLTLWPSLTMYSPFTTLFSFRSVARGIKSRGTMWLKHYNRFKKVSFVDSSLLRNSD